MSKPEEQEELTVDFFDEVEDVVDEDLALDDEKADLDAPEEQEESDEVTDQEEETELEEELDLEGEQEKTEDSEEQEEAEELPLVESIKRSLGYEIEEEFEDTEEGIQLLFEKAKEKATEEAVNSYFDRYPEVKQLLEYVEMGGEPNKFFQTQFPEVDYSEVEFKEDDTALHERLVRQELKEVRGMSDEEIRAEIEDYRNGGILENKAKRSLSALKTKQKEDKESLLEQQREEQQQYQEQVQKHWNNVKQTLDKSASIKGFKIPSKDKDPFFEYLSKPVEEGKSAAMKAHEEADLETRLAIDYLLYKGFKLSDIIDRRAKDQNVKTLRDRIREAKTLKKKEENKSTGQLEELGTI